MHHTQLLPLLGLVSAIARAGPVARTTGFASECSDITLDSEDWLVATCPNDAGDMITSSVWLPTWVENNQGKLTWQYGGNYYHTCSECSLVNSGSGLQCFCLGTYSSENGNSTLDLEEYIANYNGHLLSDLNGTPTVPSDSSVPVPADPTMTISLSTSSTTCGDSFTWEFYGPETCWWLDITGSPLTMESIELPSNPGWAVEAYNTSDCSGTPILSLGIDDVNTCHELYALYFTVTPLWNWD